MGKGHLLTVPPHNHHTGMGDVREWGTCPSIARAGIGREIVRRATSVLGCPIVGGEDVGAGTGDGDEAHMFTPPALFPI